ncbi:MAG: IS1595 family transposase [Cryomorphaceae bacterium]|nr:IS1595 family transposase [Flavobacteriales bacterium]
MRLLKELSRKEFRKNFGTKEQCMAYLSQKKWADGYQCRKCSSEHYIKGKHLCSRRCKKCGYDESPTANTLFHKVKFGIENAFEMVYDITTSKKGANSIWLAERFGVRQPTAWLFRQKVQAAMKSSKAHPLIGDVHVDEFEIGTPQKGEQGRSKSEKKMRVVIAIEHRSGACGRGYAKVIQDYSAASLRPIFTEHISSDADVLADKWTGYIPLKKSFPNLKQIKSDKGRNFPMIHQQIRNFKNWLRGVHSYCNKEHLEEYIDEYFFRFNRRNHRQSILNKAIERMIIHKPMTRKTLLNPET